MQGGGGGVDARQGGGGVIVPLIVVLLWELPWVPRCHRHSVVHAAVNGSGRG